MEDKIHFSPAEQEIVDLLRDRKWHCTYTELVMKDDRARITKIRRKLQERGYDVESKQCNLHNHDSRLVMRRIVAIAPSQTHHVAPQPMKIQYTPQSMIALGKELVAAFDAEE